MRWVFAEVVVVAVAIGATVGWAQPPGGNPFDRFDTNKDGKLSREEVPTFLKERFGEIDKDGDGFVSREEERAFFAGRGAGKAQAKGAMAGRIPDSIRVERDINYAGTDNPAQTLDVLVPKQPEGTGPLPVVVGIHGGAFKSGDKSGQLGSLIPLVASGEYAGVTINYRLSGEAIWPAQIHDCKAAVRWVRANAQKYGWDPERVGVIGSSAGGHLVAMMGTSGAVKELEGEEVGKNPDQNSRVTCVVDLFGPSELLTMGDDPSSMDHNAANSPESELIGGPVQDNKEKARAASPITYVSEGDPPILIVHGTKDPLVPFGQSVRLAKRLREVGVPTLLVPVEGAGHGNFQSPEVPRRIRQFFDKHLRGQEVGTISEEPISNESEPAGSR